MELTNYKYIRELLDRHGFHFSKSMGQNFLTAAWVPQRIAEESGVDKDTGVIEVGPGVGCLTRELAGYAGKVVAVELDNSLRPILAETLEGLDNVEVIFTDVLKTDLRAIVSDKLEGLKPAVCANLPYNITSPLLTAFIESGCFDTITVMIQREVAKRICSKAGSADYGAFSVYVGWHTEAEILFDVPPDCFTPRPKVTSSVIKLTRRATPPVPVKDEKWMFRVVRAAFNQRRKTLTNALSAGLSVPKEQTAAALESLGLDSRVRGEALDMAQFAALSDALLKND